MDPLKKLAERHHANFIFLQVQMMCIPEKHKQFVILRSQDSQATNPTQGIPHEFWLPFRLKTYFDNARFSRCFFGLEVHKSKEGWGEHQKWELGITIFVWTRFLLTVQELGIKNTRAPIEHIYNIYDYMYMVILQHPVLFRELTYPLPKVLLNLLSRLFPRWDMLVPWRVYPQISWKNFRNIPYRSKVWCCSMALWDR